MADPFLDAIARAVPAPASPPPALADPFLSAVGRAVPSGASDPFLAAVSKAMPAGTPPSYDPTQGAGNYKAVRPVDPWASIQDLAQQRGLSLTSGVRSPERNAAVGGAPGSYHLAVDDQGRPVARDFGGPPEKMAAFAQEVQRLYGKDPGLRELFYDPTNTALKNGKDLGHPIGGHSNHVHVAYLPQVPTGGNVPLSQFSTGKPVGPPSPETSRNSVAGPTSFNALTWDVAKPPSALEQASGMAAAVPKMLLPNTAGGGLRQQIIAAQEAGKFPVLRLSPGKTQQAQLASIQGLRPLVEQRSQQVIQRLNERAQADDFTTNTGGIDTDRVQQAYSQGMSPQLLETYLKGNGVNLTSLQKAALPVISATQIAQWVDNQRRKAGPAQDIALHQAAGVAAGVAGKVLGPAMEAGTRLLPGPVQQALKAAEGTVAGRILGHALNPAEIGGAAVGGGAFGAADVGMKGGTPGQIVQGGIEGAKAGALFHAGSAALGAGFAERARAQDLAQTQAQAQANYQQGRAALAQPPQEGHIVPEQPAPFTPAERAQILQNAGRAQSQMAPQEGHVVGKPQPRVQAFQARQAQAAAVVPAATPNAPAIVPGDVVRVTGNPELGNLDVQEVRGGNAVLVPRNARFHGRPVKVPVDQLERQQAPANLAFSPRAPGSPAGPVVQSPTDIATAPAETPPPETPNEPLTPQRPTTSLSGKTPIAGTEPDPTPMPVSASSPEPSPTHPEPPIAPEHLVTRDGNITGLTKQQSEDVLNLHALLTDRPHLTSPPYPDTHTFGDAVKIDRLDQAMALQDHPTIRAAAEQALARQEAELQRQDQQVQSEAAREGSAAGSQGLGYTQEHLSNGTRRSFTYRDDAGKARTLHYVHLDGLMDGSDAAARGREAVYAVVSKGVTGDRIWPNPAGGKGASLHDLVVNQGMVPREISSRYLKAPTAKVPVPETIGSASDLAANLQEHFRLAPERARAVAALADARAQTWAETTGKSKGDWYRRYIAGVTTKPPPDATSPGAKAAISFLPDLRAMFHALKNPDVSSAIHEFGHAFRRDLYDTLGANHADIKALEAWTGEKDGNWSVDSEERFARGLERYTRDGIAPAPKLEPVFQRFRRWMTNLYRNVKEGPLREDVHPNVRAVFDRMLGGEGKVAERGGGVPMQALDAKAEEAAALKNLQVGRKASPQGSLFEPGASSTEVLAQKRPKNLTPQEMFRQEVSRYGASQIAQGVTDRMAWDTKVLAAAGPEAKPHLDALWKESQAKYRRDYAPQGQSVSPAPSKPVAGTESPSAAKGATEANPRGVGGAIQTMERNVEAGLLPRVPKAGTYLPEAEARRQAQALIRKNPSLPQELADEAMRTGRAHNQIETMVLNEETARLTKVADRINDRMKAAAEAGDTAERDRLYADWQKAREDLRSFQDRRKFGSTATGGGFYAHQSGIDIDTGSLTNVLERARSERKGEPLPKAQEAQITRSVQEVAKARAAQAEAELLNEQLAAERDHANHRADLLEARVGRQQARDAVRRAAGEVGVSPGEGGGGGRSVVETARAMRAKALSRLDTILGRKPATLEQGSGLVRTLAHAEPLETYDSVQHERIAQAVARTFAHEEAPGEGLLDRVVKRTIDTLKEHGVNVSRDDIIRELREGKKAPGEAPTPKPVDEGKLRERQIVAAAKAEGAPEKAPRAPASTPEERMAAATEKRKATLRKQIADYEAGRTPEPSAEREVTPKDAEETALIDRRDTLRRKAGLRKQIADLKAGNEPEPSAAPEPKPKDGEEIALVKSRDILKRKRALDADAADLEAQLRGEPSGKAVRAKAEVPEELQARVARNNALRKQLRAKQSEAEASGAEASKAEIVADRARKRDLAAQAKARRQQTEAEAGILPEPSTRGESRGSAETRQAQAQARDAQAQEQARRDIADIRTGKVIPERAPVEGQKSPELQRLEAERTQARKAAVWREKIAKLDAGGEPGRVPTSPESDPEIAGLKEEYGRKRRLRALDEQKADLEARLAGAEKAERVTKPGAPLSPEETAKRAEVKGLREQVAKLDRERASVQRSVEQAAKYNADLKPPSRPRTTPSEEAQASRATANEARTAYGLRQRIKLAREAQSGDTAAWEDAKKARQEANQKAKAARQASDRVTSLRAEADLLDAKVLRLVQARDMQPWERMLQAAGFIPRLARGLKTIHGLAAFGRNAGILTLQNTFRHPRANLNALGQTIMAMRDPVSAARIHQSILASLEGTGAEEAGLKIQPVAGLAGLTPGEEEALHNLFPGWTKYNVMESATRGFATTLNSLRATAYLDMIRMNRGRWSAADKGLFARYINSASGVETLGLPEKSNALRDFNATTKVANKLLFAARFALSRIVFPLRAVVGGGMGGSAVAHTAVYGHVATTLATFASFMMLAKASGAKVSLDPDDAHFLQPTWGPHTLDLGAGILQYMIFASRMIHGRAVNAQGKEQNLEGMYGSRKTRADLVGTFVRGRLAPVPALIGDVLAHKGDWSKDNVASDFRGRPVGIAGEIGRTFSPIGWERIGAEMKQDGVPTTVIRQLFRAFGVHFETEEAE